jgi:hypothetical protein
MKRVTVLVPLVAVALGLAALSLGFGLYQDQKTAQLLQSGAAASQSHGQTASPSKQQLWPLDRIDVVLLIVIAVCLSLAGGAGIGGGAVLVPVFIMLRGEHAPSPARPAIQQTYTSETFIQRRTSWVLAA